MRVSTLLGEAARTAVAQRVSSVLVAVLCGGICAGALLTMGRTAAAEDQLLSRLDSAGSRLLVVSDDRGAGLVTPAAVAAIAGLDTTEHALGVDVPVDVTNQVIGVGGTRVPAWRVTGRIDQAVELLAGRWPRPREAIVAEGAQVALGLVYPAGAVVDTNGVEHPVVGSFAARPPFDQFAAGAVIAGDDQAAVRSVHVVVASVAAAQVTEALVMATLAPPDLGGVTVESPAALVELQQALGGDLGSFGRGTLVLTLGGGALLIAAVVLAEVLLGRRDLGRRRALGAARWGLLTLVVARTVFAALPGAAAGISAGAAAAGAWAELPPVDFTAATGVLAMLVAATAAVPPALLAAARDPVGILRTP